MWRRSANVTQRISPALLRDPGHFIALGGGTGLAPKAPGTFGTCAGLGLYLLLAGLPPMIYGGVVALMFVVGVPICARTAARLGVHDHPGIVWDECVGFLVTMMLSVGGMVSTLLGFVLFRLFDIWKPWPIRYLDRHIKSGFGIMVDDLLAGAFAAIGLALFEYLSYS